MAKLRGSQKLVIKFSEIMRKIDKENEGTSSFNNYSVGIVNYLTDNFYLKIKENNMRCPRCKQKLINGKCLCSKVGV